MLNEIKKKVAMYEKVHVYQSKVSIIEQHYYLWEKNKTREGTPGQEESWSLSSLCSVIAVSLHPAISNKAEIS